MTLIFKTHVTFPYDESIKGFAPRWPRYLSECVSWPQKCTQCQNTCIYIVLCTCTCIVGLCPWVYVAYDQSNMCYAMLWFYQCKT